MSAMTLLEVKQAFEGLSPDKDILREAAFEYLLKELPENKEEDRILQVARQILKIFLDDAVARGEGPLVLVPALVSATAEISAISCKDDQVVETAENLWKLFFE